MSNYPYEDDELTHLFESIGLFILCPVLISLMPLLIYDDYKNGRSGNLNNYIYNNTCISGIYNGR